jgi:preprotein translocase subunit SecG
MSWLHTTIMILHVLFAAGIVGLVLLQRGKGADAGAGFGSGASGTVFGARGSASFLSRTTALLAVLFFSTSLTLAYMSAHSGKVSRSVVDREQLPAAPIDDKKEPLSAPAETLPAPVTSAPEQPAK